MGVPVFPSYKGGCEVKMYGKPRLRDQMVGKSKGNSVCLEERAEFLQVNPGPLFS